LRPFSCEFVFLGPFDITVPTCNNFLRLCFTPSTFLTFPPRFPHLYTTIFGTIPPEACRQFFPLHTTRALSVRFGPVDLGDHHANCVLPLPPCLVFPCSGCPRVSPSPDQVSLWHRGLMCRPLCSPRRPMTVCTPRLPFILAGG